MKRWRNEATRLRRKAIKSYWNEISLELNENPRKFFSTFMPFISSKGQKETNEIHLNIEGRIEQDQRIVAEEFADYFSTVADAIGGEEATNLTEEKCINHRSIEMIRARYEPDSFSFIEIKREEVLKALKELNPRKATGHDEIPSKVLKLVAEEIATPLTDIFNQVIKYCEWPQEWKMGEWIPAYKKDDHHDKANYRPVTILSILDKIFEQLLCQQLSQRFENIFDPFISAYRKNYSCEIALVRLVEDWKQAMDEGQTISILSTDMSKAFDSLHPTLLLAKLKAYGFTQNALDLMKSYFKERMNRTKMRQVTSEWKETKRGCPQGSSLGPTLWNIYQNDLFYVERESRLSAYADDHQLYYAHKEPERAVDTVTRDGKQTFCWYTENFLEGNLSKYQAMTISKNSQELNIEVDSCKIKITEKLILLGVEIDDQLYFDEHISTACKKASMRVGILMRLRKLIPVNAKLKIYKAAILPYLTYCGLVWHFCKSSDCRKLERVNERGLRAVFCDWNSTYEDLLLRAQLTSLYNRRLQDIAIFMFKVKHRLLPNNILNIFINTPRNYNLRNSDFLIPRFKSVKFGKHSLRYYGPYLWSKLKSEDRNQTSLSAFKRSIRKTDLSCIA